MNHTIRFATLFLFFLLFASAQYTLSDIKQEGDITIDDSKLPTGLSAAEIAEGWTLLFDGQSLNGWRNFRKSTIGSSWKVADGAIYLDAKKQENGHWQAANGGDIITDGQFENYELQLEWKIGDCGNSGIIYNVVELESCEYVWQTGPEIQVLDNTCHPDGKLENHRAGSLYDMIAPRKVAVKPAGEWNKVRLRVKNGKVKEWLNGKKIVEFEMFTPEWDKMIASSKFKDMPNFGKSRKGHIALQDHGDPVWYRNIKIKKLK
ncbi:MAG: glycosyl hydrolase [Saprospiraceae bacterium]|nr:MAG: glycosyl hydrolase [Saprospiraceae bacterium]